MTETHQCQYLICFWIFISVTYDYVDGLVFSVLAFFLKFQIISVTSEMTVLGAILRRGPITGLTWNKFKIKGRPKKEPWQKIGGI